VYLAGRALHRDDAGLACLLDGGAPFLVDLYGTPTRSWVVWTSPDLAYGVHVLKVEQTTNHNPAAIGDNVTIDAVNVLGTLVY
jgi:hypothetical protein